LLTLAIGWTFQLA